MKRRQIDILVISDAHLGSFGTHAKELILYLRSIKPKLLILNGDMIDMWRFSRYYFPKSHTMVLHEILRFSNEGVPVYYLTGNHDDILRRFSDLSLGEFHLVDNLILNIKGEKAWIFHGDAFDGSITKGRSVAQFGAFMHDWAMLSNKWIMRMLKILGLPAWSYTKFLKDTVKGAVKSMGDFETIAAQKAIAKGYRYVICGHVHKPQMREIKIGDESILYLNSGDWLENLTSLEYYGGEWHLYKFDAQEYPSLKKVRSLNPDVNHFIQKVESSNPTVEVFFD